MQQKGVILVASLAAALLLTACAQPGAGSMGNASNVPAPEAASDTASAQPADVVASGGEQLDGNAIGALTAMGNYLRTLAQFQVDADSSTDLVLDNGQNASFPHHTVLKVRRPNRMRADITGGRTDRGLVYDGRNFVIFSTGDGYYSRNPAPPTLDGLVEELASTYDIETPLADLFYWGNDPGDDRVLTSAQDLGVQRIDTRTCNHYVFQQPGVDWELWIEKGARPLPCRMVITDTTQASRPRHAVTYHWNLHPSFNASTFVWHPSANAKPVELKPATGSPFLEAQ